MVILKSPQEIDKMKRSGRIIAEICQLLSQEVRPGITTKSLDIYASNAIKDTGAKPAFLGFKGYPATICTSVNEQVVHGIPGQYTLKSGDIIGIDVGIVYDGYCSDMAITVPVGTVSGETKRLIDVTREALYIGINQMVEGNRLYDISSAIQEHVEKNGFSVVRDLTGHGVGQDMHEDPQVPNFGRRGTGMQLKRGAVFALEPMVNQGDYGVVTLPDNWTVVTTDGSLSAHFEHTIAITGNGPEILTEL